LPVIATGIKDPTAEDCMSDNFTPKEFSLSSIIRILHTMSYYCISIPHWLVLVYKYVVNNEEQSIVFTFCFIATRTCFKSKYNDT
jgi:hypothetical protein